MKIAFKIKTGRVFVWALAALIGFGLGSVVGVSEASARTFLGEGLFTRNQGKDSTRWTLAGWMTQKQNFRLMDQWLALNQAKGIFEINLEGGRRTYDLTVGGNVKEKAIDHYGLTIFWSIFGLSYEFEDSNEDFKRESAQFNLRLFGTSSQTTNLTGFYGVRKWTYDDPANEVQNNYAGGKLTLYITDFFGLEGDYRKFFRATDDNDAEQESDRVSYGAFIDVYFIRLYGEAFKEKSEVTPSGGGATTKEEREGSQLGVKFYF